MIFIAGNQRGISNLPASFVGSGCHKTDKMGNGMNKIVTGLYVGNFRDAKDREQLTKNQITHILSIHDQARPLLDDMKYLCIVASDNAQQDLTQYFSQCNDFIHSARLANGRVLVHCLAGVSRSVTVTAAYLMTVTNLGWRDAINSIRGARNCANPNFGFQRQLQDFQFENVDKERERFRKEFPVNPFDDAGECDILLKSFRDFVLHGDTSRDDGLYNLPHKAYKKSNGTNSQDSDTSANTDSQKFTNGATSSNNSQNQDNDSCDNMTEVKNVETDDKNDLTTNGNTDDRKSEFPAVTDSANGLT